MNFNKSRQYINQGKKLGFDLSDIDLNDDSISLENELIQSAPKKFEDIIIKCIDEEVNKILEKEQEIKKWTDDDHDQIFVKEYPILSTVCQETSPYKNIWRVPHDAINTLRRVIKLVCKHVVSPVNLNWIDLSQMTSLKYHNGDMSVSIFNDIEEDVIIDQWNVGNITDMSYLFYSTSFNGDISKWDVSKVENMNSMFQLSSFDGDLSRWDVSNVQDMAFMFNMSKFNGDISNWDVSNVQDMCAMFKNSVFNGYINDWNVSNVKNMDGMFQDNKVFNQPLDKWYDKLSNLKYMRGMFYNTKSFDQDLHSWQISSSKTAYNILTFLLSKVTKDKQPQFD